MDKATLETLTSQGLSMNEIARETGYSQTNVRHWLKKYGLVTHWTRPSGFKPRPRRMRVFSDEEVMAIQAHYDDGGTYRSILKTFGISSAPLNRLVKEGRLHLRTACEAARQATKLGRRDVFKTPEYREVMRVKIQKRLVEHPELHPNRLLAANRKKMSFPERRLFDELIKLDIRFQHNGKIGRYYVDFLFPTFGIEVDGKRWHDAQRDAKRDAEIATHGIEIVRFDSQVAAKKPQVIIAEIQRRLSLRSVA